MNARYPRAVSMGECIRPGSFEGGVKRDGTARRRAGIAAAVLLVASTAACASMPSRVGAIAPTSIPTPLGTAAAARAGMEVDTGQSKVQGGSSPWGGLSVLSKKALSGVTMSFTVPQVDCSGSYFPQMVAIWGGLTEPGALLGENDLIEQAGITIECPSAQAQPEYSEFAENAPLPPQYNNGQLEDIEPGDTIHITIDETDDGENFALALRDVTDGQEFDTTLSCPEEAHCDFTTATGMAESPYSSNGGVYGMPDFSPIQFTGATAILSDGQQVPFGSFPDRMMAYSAMTSIYQTGAVLAEPTTPEGGAFSIVRTNPGVPF